LILAKKGYGFFLGCFDIQKHKNKEEQDITKRCQTSTLAVFSDDIQGKRKKGKSSGKERLKKY